VGVGISLTVEEDSIEMRSLLNPHRSPVGSAMALSRSRSSGSQVRGRAGKKKKESPLGGLGFNRASSDGGSYHRSVDASGKKLMSSLLGTKGVQVSSASSSPKNSDRRSYKSGSADSDLDPFLRFAGRPSYADNSAGSSADAEPQTFSGPLGGPLGSFQASWEEDGPTSAKGMLEGIDKYLSREGGARPSGNKVSDFAITKQDLKDAAQRLNERSERVLKLKVLMDHCSQDIIEHLDLHGVPPRRRELARKPRGEGSKAQTFDFASVRGRRSSNVSLQSKSSSQRSSLTPPKESASSPSPPPPRPARCATRPPSSGPSRPPTAPSRPPTAPTRPTSPCTPPSPPPASRSPPPPAAAAPRAPTGGQGPPRR